MISPQSPTTAAICAGIDIGTNTILMVVVSVQANGVTATIRDEHAIVRLGEGLEKTGNIGREALARAILVLTAYRTLLDDLAVTRLRVVATSAVRDAQNAGEVRAAFESLLRHPVEVISGDEEARLTFVGTVGATSLPATVVDIGGGSTEIASGHMGVVTHAQSAQIGVIRLTERHLATKPAHVDAVAAARLDVSTALSALSTQDCCGTLFAVAGTPVALAALDLGLKVHDASKLDGHTLSVLKVAERARSLQELSLPQLLALPGMDARRAELLPAGAMILHEVMRKLDVQECIVSTRGLRYGVVLSANGLVK